MPDAKVAPEEKEKEVILSAGDIAAAVIAADIAEKKLAKERLQTHVKTEKYADDQFLYKPRITDDERFDYFTYLQRLGPKNKKKVPNGFNSWVNYAIHQDNDLLNYPTILVKILFFVKSSIWDMIYLFLLLIWIFLLIIFQDGWMRKLFPSFEFKIDVPGQNFDTSMNTTEFIISENATRIDWYPDPISTNPLISIPLILMLFVQIIPTFGMIFFIIRCNDLVRYCGTQNLGTWAFNSVLIAQFIEYNFYGGCGKSSSAGKCRLDPNRVSMLSKFAHFTGIVKEEENFVEKILNEDEEYLKYGFDVEEEEEFDDDDLDDEEIGKSLRLTAQKLRDEQFGADLASLANTKDEEENNNNLESGENNDEEKPKKQLNLLEKNALAKIEEYQERKRLAAEERALRLYGVTDFKEWKCLCCGKDNREPRHPTIESDLFFGTQGDIFKRTFTIIKKRKDMPVCLYCGVYADYKPPIGSAHTFVHNPDPHLAYANYPIVARIQNGLKDTKNDPFYRFMNTIDNFFYGLRNDPKSLLTYNDWRLRLFVFSKFPEMPRQKKPKNEIFDVGEVVECMQQRSEWCRCRILVSRSNHTYDIRYDPGDELRYVFESALRLPPEKGAFSYNVEICLVLLVLLIPVGLVFACADNSSGIFIGPLLIGCILLSLRLYAMFDYIQTFFNAGCCVIFKTSMFFTLPLIFLVIASLAPLTGAEWSTVATFWIITKITVLPVLYVARPFFAVFALFLFVQTSLCFILLADYVTFIPDGVTPPPLIVIPLFPLFTSVLTLLYYRKTLHMIWDVCLTIRPPLNYDVTKPTLLNQAWDYLNDMISGFS